MMMHTLLPAYPRFILAFLLVCCLSLLGPAAAQDIIETPTPEATLAELTATPTPEPPTATVEILPSATFIEAATALPTTELAPTTDAATATPETTASTSPTLPAEFTPLPSLTPTLASFNLIYSEDFESTLDPLNWVLPSGWSSTSNETGIALLQTGDAAPVEFLPVMFDGEAEIELRFSSGAAILNLRQSTAGAYSIFLNTSGSLSLLRNGQPLAATGITLSGNSQRLAVRIIGTAITITLNDMVILQVDDPAPLPAGRMTISGSGTAEAGLLIDNLILRVPPASEVPAPTLPGPTATLTETATPEVTTEITVDATAEVIPEAEATAEANEVSALGLGTPALLAPASNGLSTSARPALRWSAVPAATGYRIAFGLTDDPAQAFLNIPLGLTTTYTLTAALPQCDCRWWVAARDATGDGAWSAPFRLRINVQLAPGAFAFTTLPRPTLMWAGVPGATAYLVQIARDAAFTDIAATSPAFIGTSWVPPALPFGRYYWRVNINRGASSGNTMEFSPWSHTLTISPGPSAPLVPVAPANALLTNTLPINLDWSNVAPTAAGAPFTYQLQIDNQNTFTSPEVFVADLTDSAYSLATLAGDGAYYWRVRSVNTYGWPSGWNAARILTVDRAAPAPPVITAPLYNATISQARPTITWQVPQGGATQYQIQVSYYDDFNTLMVPEQTLTTTSYTLPISLGQGTYYVRVRARDAAGNQGDYPSSGHKFHFIVPLSPANGAGSINRQPVFTWAAVPGATAYQFQLSTQDDFAQGTLIAESPAFVGTSYAYPAALPPLNFGTYYWRVNVNRGAINNNVMEFSPFEFRLIITPSIPTQLIATTPANTFATALNNITLNWALPPATLTGGPFTYQLQVDNTNTFASPEYTELSLSTNTLTLTNVPDATYFWRGRIVNSYGVGGPWSVARSFTIDTTAPAEPTLLAPIDAAIVDTVLPLFQWSRPAGVVRFRLDYSTSSSFSHFISAGTTATQFTPLTQLLPTTYYWRVTGFDAVGNASTAAIVRSVTLRTPLNIAPIPVWWSDATPSLNWVPVRNALTYEVQVFNIPTLAGTPLWQTGSTTQPSADVDVALPDGVYYWRVRARLSPTVATLWSSVGVFAVDQ
jgi:hypothetical protein